MDANIIHKPPAKKDYPLLIPEHLDRGFRHTATPPATTTMDIKIRCGVESFSAQATETGGNNLSRGCFSLPGRRFIGVVTRGCSGDLPRGYWLCD